ncbi:BQ5605_C014g07487 [Microbotryum silenes-dioicae]|uniref:BQ5605_C014g07487 protein n=1 Tax=Microbotryum silenes-dioicae TaxID=796604 RepID=A0A2X0MFB1_9BASI|nr:BQ5605_C014g07487 [Microbotryum silenes-dioicae]
MIAEELEKHLNRDEFQPAETHAPSMLRSFVSPRRSRRTVFKVKLCLQSLRGSIHPSPDPTLPLAERSPLVAAPTVRLHLRLLLGSQ